MKTFYEAIYEWVDLNFGPHEAQDPSWNIEALAKHLSEQDIDPDELNANTKNNVYDRLRERYLDEDIEQVAEARGVVLTKDEINEVKRRYYKLGDETWEQLAILIDDIKAERR